MKMETAINHTLRPVNRGGVRPGTLLPCDSLPFLTQPLSSLFLTQSRNNTIQDISTLLR